MIILYVSSSSDLSTSHCFAFLYVFVLTKLRTALPPRLHRLDRGAVIASGPPSEILPLIDNKSEGRNYFPSDPPA